MPRQLYIVDFDRTIFDTHRFFTDIQAALQQRHNLDLKEFADTFNAFIDPDNGGYDLHRHHHKLLGLPPDELDDVIKTELDDQDYTFPDAAAWLKSHKTDEEDIIIMTVGLPRYQALKFHHSAAVRDLRKIVVSTNKGALIRRHLEQGSGEYGLGFLDQPYEHITLIDDSADTFTALGSEGKISGIRICRPGERYADLPTPPHIRQITSFGDLS